MGRAGHFKTFAWFIGFAVVFSMWSIATPFWTSHDAPQHDLYAWAIGHGDWMPEKTDVFANDVNTNAIVMAPSGAVESALSAHCFARDQFLPASCISPIKEDTEETEYISSAARNFPVYYAVVGVISNLGSPSQGLALMRVTSIVLVAWLMAWAASGCLQTRRPGLALTGLAIACTPMFAFLGGVVNPNTIEIASAYATGVCCLLFLDDPTGPNSQKMLRRAAIAATILGSTRILGPVWLGIWVLALLVLHGRDLIRVSLRARNRWWIIVPVMGIIANMAWMLQSGVNKIRSNPVFELSLMGRLKATTHDLWISLLQTVGNFGRLEETLVPRHAIVIYAISAFVLVGQVLLRLDRRTQVAVLSLAAMALLAPLLLETWKYNWQGPVWQGRYLLPTIGLIPIFALTAAATARGKMRALDSPVTRWIVVGMWIVILYTHLAAIRVWLERAMYGQPEPGAEPFDMPPWQPFISPWLIVTVIVLTLILGAIVVSRMMWTSQRTLVQGDAQA